MESSGLRKTQHGVPVVIERNPQMASRAADQDLAVVVEKDSQLTVDHK